MVTGAGFVSAPLAQTRILPFSSSASLWASMISSFRSSIYASSRSNRLCRARYETRPWRFKRVTTCSRIASNVIPHLPSLDDLIRHPGSLRSLSLSIIEEGDEVCQKTKKLHTNPVANQVRNRVCMLSSVRLRGRRRAQLMPSRTALVGMSQP